MKFVPLLFCLVVFCFQQTFGLYEDQVGKFDWRHQFVGRVDQVLRTPGIDFLFIDFFFIDYFLKDIWQDHQSLILSTKSNVISGLHLRNGSIHWRHILEEQKPINYLSSMANIKSNSFSCPVLSVNSNGRYVRCWTFTGVLLFEYSFPNEFVSEIEKDSR